MSEEQLDRRALLEQAMESADEQEPLENEEVLEESDAEEPP